MAHPTDAQLALVHRLNVTSAAWARFFAQLRESAEFDADPSLQIVAYATYAQFSILGDMVAEALGADIFAVDMDDFLEMRRASYERAQGN